MDDITKEAILAFLLPSGNMNSTQKDEEQWTAKSSKEILRTTMLRFHPDKFETRVLQRVKDADRSRVKEVASAIVHILNALMKDNASG